MLSLTASSGRPTNTVLGKPAEASTSTSTGTPSIPTSAKVFSLASMTGPSLAATPRGGACVPAAPRAAAKQCQSLASALLALGRCRVQYQALDGEPGAKEDHEQREDSAPKLHGPGGESPPSVLVALEHGFQ